MFARTFALQQKFFSSSSFDTTTTRKDDEEKKRVEFGSMIQLANGASNYEDVMELYPADCDFAKKTTGLEKVEHECNGGAVAGCRGDAERDEYVS